MVMAKYVAHERNPETPWPVSPAFYPRKIITTTKDPRPQTYLNCHNMPMNPKQSKPNQPSHHFGQKEIQS